MNQNNGEDNSMGLVVVMLAWAALMVVGGMTIRAIFYTPAVCGPECYYDENVSPNPSKIGDPEAAEIIKTPMPEWKAEEGKDKA